MRLRALLPRSLRERLDLHRRAVDRFAARAARETVAGSVVVDAGAGEGPYRELFGHCRFLGLDDRRGDRAWDYRGLDLVGDLRRIPLRDGAADVVFSTETLEHLTDPQEFLIEACRILRPGGRLWMTAPLTFREHQEPHDYFRYTRHGVRLLLERAGLAVVAIDPEGGYFSMLGDKVQAAHRVLFAKDRHLVWKALFLLLQPVSMLLFTVALPLLCAALDPLDTRRRHTTGFLVIAERPRGASQS